MTKAQVEKEMKSDIEALAQTWPEGDTNVIDMMATAIEADIPADTDNEDAIKARENAQLARKFGMTDKGVIHIVDAQCAFKDYMLWKDSLKGEKFPSGKPKGSLTNCTKHIHQLCADNPYSSAKELFQHADKKIIGKMGFGTFENHVTDGRKIYPKKKKASK